METKLFTRKPFAVNAVQVTLQNIQEVAEWCNGTIEYRQTKMMNTTIDLPFIVLKGLSNTRGQDPEAAFGHWVVELKGKFRTYKPQQFETTFEEVSTPDVEVLVDGKVEPKDEVVYNQDSPEEFVAPVYEIN
jgi:hypothetical protein